MSHWIASGFAVVTLFLVVTFPVAVPATRPAKNPPPSFSRSGPRGLNLTLKSVRRLPRFAVPGATWTVPRMISAGTASKP